MKELTVKVVVDEDLLKHADEPDVHRAVMDEGAKVVLTAFCDAAKAEPDPLCTRCLKLHAPELPCVSDPERVARIRRWLLEDGTPPYLLVDEDVFALLRRIDELEAMIAEQTT